MRWDRILGDLVDEPTQRKPRMIIKKKQPDNEFKVRHMYRNNLNQSTFKITKKFWLDIEWCYKVRYMETGNEVIFTERHFRDLVKESRFRRIVDSKTGDEHFDDNELFQL